MKIGHDLSEEEIFSRVKEFWDLSGKFPLPRFELRCPICNASDDDIILREITFTVRRAGGIPYRANVSFKCTRCSFTWIHGVPITQEMASIHGLDKGYARGYNWREIRKEVGR